MTKLNQISSKTTINIRGKLMSLAKPRVMGIINLTPDSFYSGSRAESLRIALAFAGKMLDEGADFLDLGGFSSRPGAQEVSEAEELSRVLPVVEAIMKEYPEAMISIDTFRASVARQALDAGAVLVNDITGGLDPDMFPLIAEKQVPYVMMHMRGSVVTMMDDLAYDNLLLEITHYFQQRITRLKALGVKDIIIDPGFGFSKSLDQNYEILKNLAYFEAIDTPVLVGLSRKSMIYKLLGTTPDEALTSTNVLNYVALEKGARILRVHDVKEAVETVQLYNKLAG